MSKKEKKPPRISEDEDLEALFLGEKERGDVGGFPDLLEEYLDGPLPRSEKEPKAKRGTVRPFKKRGSIPQVTLDLHGLTRKEAIQKLSFFLENRGYQGGSQWVSVVTGKGLHSEGRPVLKDAVEVFLIKLKKEGRIKGFRWEKKKKGKSGVVFVEV